MNNGGILKIIFSRKGWDSSAGGKPNPIFSGDGFSLPIPDDPLNSISYSDLNPGVLPSPYRNLAAFLKVYSPAFNLDQRAHLDPDLDGSAYRPRLPGWIPCFGQENGAATHLDNNGVDVGDIFIFYGWFADVNMTNGLRQHRDRFCVFGYLQIGQIFHNPSTATTPSWLHYHPHITNAPAYKNNRIYVAPPKLTGAAGISLPGGGILNPADPPRCLTTTVGKRGLFPDRLLSHCPEMTRHRQEHVWLPDWSNKVDVDFIEGLLS